MKKTFFDKDWGFMHGEISKYKFDFLPRITAVTTTHMLELSVGFLCFRMWLTIFSRQVQEFNKVNRQ